VVGSWRLVAATWQACQMAQTSLIHSGFVRHLTGRAYSFIISA
jgi:hypothetical protein